MMKERWLEDFGFKVGQKYNVDCQNKKLIIYIAESLGIAQRKYSKKTEN